MTTISASLPRIDAPCTETGDVEIHDHVHNYVRAMALALADPEMRQRFQLIIQAYDRLAAGHGKDGEPALLPEIASRDFCRRASILIRPVPTVSISAIVIGERQKGSTGQSCLRHLDRSGGTSRRGGRQRRVGRPRLAESLRRRQQSQDPGLRVTPLPGRSRRGRRLYRYGTGRGYNFVAPVNFAEARCLTGQTRGGQMRSVIHTARRNLMVPRP